MKILKINHYLNNHDIPKALVKQIKKKLADKAKNCKSVTAFFRYTKISNSYNFVSISNIQG